MIKSDLTDIPFFEDYLRNTRRLANSTIYVYMQTLQTFLSTNPDIDQLEEYNEFLIRSCIKKRSTSQYSTLKIFIEWKIKDAATKRRLVEGLIKPPIRKDIKKERRHLSENQLFDVINGLESKRHRIIALIQCLTGVRAGDVLRLKRGSILAEEYEKKPVLRLNIIGKGRKLNVIFIHDEIGQQVIMDYITSEFTHEKYYFLTEIKPRPNRTFHFGDFATIRKNYERYLNDLKIALQRAGVNKDDFATHDFRRCFARRVWEKYKDIHILQNILNHARAEVTLRYLDQSGLKNIDYHYEMQK